MKVRYALLGTAAFLAFENVATAQTAPESPAPSTAGAQDENSSAEQSDTNASSYGDIIVTAQHRQESVQSVPISISAFDAQTIQNLGISAPQDVFKQTPNVRYQEPAGIGSFPIYVIRGITQLDFNYLSEASIASYRDGVYMGTTALGAQPLYDMERIEVLRGPQGTLWGRNATGGLLHFISARPTDTFTGTGTLELANYGHILAMGAVSGPLSAGIRGRLAVRYNDLQGVQRNVVGTRRRHWTIDDAIAARGTLEADLSEDTLATISAHYSKKGGQESLRYTKGRRVPGNTGVACALEQILAGVCVNTAGFRRDDNNPELGYSELSSQPYHNTLHGGFIEVDHDFGSVSLTSITGYERVKLDDLSDIDSTHLSTPQVFSSIALKHRQLSQELRLAGETGRLSWQLGGIYYSDKRSQWNTQPVQNASAWADQEIDSKALFAQATYSPVDTVNLTAGARYTWDEKDINLNLVSSGYVPFRRVGTPRPNGILNSTVRDRQFTWRLAADWHPVSNVMIFASAATGYKLGGYNPNAALNLSGAGPAKSETSISYEAGVKAQLIDRLLTANLTGFYTKWKDIQASISVPGNNGGVVAQYGNIGTATIKGFEAELRVRPSDSLSISAGMGYNDNKLRTPPGFLIGGLVVDGNRLANTPKVQLNGSASWEPELSSGAHFLSGIDVSYQSKIFYRPDNLPFAIQGPYTLVDARIGWAAPENRYRIELFAKNLFDKRYFVSASALADQALYVWGSPRTYGIRASTKF